MDISAMTVQLRSLLTGPFGGQSAQQAIREMVAPDPALFFECGMAVLQLLRESPAKARAYARLFDCPEFLLELFRPGRYDDVQLSDHCAAWIKIDGFLDVRLARLAPGRHEDPFSLPPEQVARLLRVLHSISTGPRLILILNHLKHHSNTLVAESATVLVGRRIRNLNWVKQRLSSSEPRIRAAAVEGLWGSDTPSARALLRQCRDDENSRVAANALLGLYFLGDANAAQWLAEMARDQRPSFRQSAVWAMGQMGNKTWTDDLQVALHDTEGEVRLAAKQAMAVIRKAPSEEAPAVEQPTFLFRFDGSFRTVA
jgi:hypothetical protein